MCVFLRFLEHAGDVCSSIGDIPNLVALRSADAFEMQCFRGCHVFPSPCPYVLNAFSRFVFGFIAKTFRQDLDEMLRPSHFLQHFQQPKLDKNQPIKRQQKYLEMVTHEFRAVKHGNPKSQYQIQDSCYSWRITDIHLCCFNPDANPRMRTILSIYIYPISVMESWLHCIIFHSNQ